jgi:hypothetical protein
LAWQLTGCGSDGDPIATSEASEIRTSDATVSTAEAPAKPAPTADPTVASAGTQVSSAEPSATTNATTSAPTAILTSSDARVVWWIDPRKPFADLKKWKGITQIHGPNQRLEELPEPGVIGSGTDYAFSRGVDPLDSTKAAFRHRIGNSFPTWGTVGARRSEVSANWSSDGTNTLRGVEYWMAFAIKFDPDMFGTGNGSASLMEFHQVPDPGENWIPSGLNMYAGENSISFSVRWDTSQPSIAKNPAQKTIWSESAPSTTQWHWIVMKFRMHWDVAQKPYVTIWRAVGDGPLKQLVDYHGPIEFNNVTPYIPQKFGIYRWDSWSGKPTRTMYTKGAYVFKVGAGTPAVNEQSLLEMLRQI